jgi:hypothetical protein
VTLTAALAAASAALAQPSIYPNKGQSQAQQTKDHNACHSWAVKQTGFDPSIALPAPQKSGGVAKGALVGGAIGGVAGSFNANAGKGLLAGAAVGGLINGVRQGNQNKEARDRQAQAHDAYNRALYACMNGRGYTVR